MTVVVRGLSWAHTRGHAPLVATSSAFSDQHPELRFEWTPRSLLEFASGGLEHHLGKYDLVALDHPLIGEAVEQGWLQPLDEVLTPAELTELDEGSIGPSFRSYHHGGRTWAAPLDVSALTSAHRVDLLDAAGVEPPSTLDELIELARSTGRVAIPLSVFSAAATFFSLCAQDGGDLFPSDTDRLVDHGVATDALDRLRALAGAVAPECLGVGAVHLLSRLASSDDLLCVGYAYGYGIYARPGYFPHRIEFRPPPPVTRGAVGRPTLGGVGLALLARAPRPAAATEYLRWVTAAPCQTGLFATSGGQPAHRDAWEDPDLDRLHGGYFSATAASVRHAYLRPNAAWFGRFQVIAGGLLQDHIRSGTPAARTVAALDLALAAARREGS